MLWNSQLGLRGRLSWPRGWRVTAWGGASPLIVNGGVNVVVSGALLAGLLRPVGGYDVAAMVGQPLLWDRLFFI